MLSLRPVRVKSCVVSLLLLLEVAAVSGCGPQTKDGPRISSYANLHKIGVAIRDYTDEHGVRPKYLSDIIPQYVPFDQISIFYISNSLTKEAIIPKDWASNPSLIDRYASYIYLGANTELRILACEKTNLWKTEASRSGEVAVLFSDFHVQYLPVVQLQELLSGAAPER
jgi:hypothetical protein